MEDTSAAKPYDFEEVCELIISSFLMGIYRLQAAEIGYLASKQPLKEYERSPRNQKAAGLKVFDFEIYSHVIFASLFVYATSLFDVFLSDIVRFLFNKDIGALGKNCLVPIEVLASPEASGGIINKEIEKKTRNLAYKSFLDRIEFLSDTFGIQGGLTNDQKATLERMSDLRNKIVHDQSLCVIRFDQNQKRTFQVKGGLLAPINVRHEDLNCAKRIYVTVAHEIYQSLRREILKLPESLTHKEGTDALLKAIPIGTK